MTPLEILLSFAQIIFPVSLVVPTILGVLRPAAPPVALAVLFFIPIAELWTTIAVAVVDLFPQAKTEAWTAIATLLIVGVLLTYGLMRIAPFTLEVNLGIKVGLDT
jgi:hypothetical protein